VKLSDALIGYWLDRETELAERSIEKYKDIFHRFVEFIGNPEIEDISSKDIKRYLVHLAKEATLSDRSISDQHPVLSSLWTWAENELGIEHIIRGKVSRPKYTKRQVEPVPPSDVRKLLNACEWSKPYSNKPYSRNRRPTALRDKAIILVMFDCGIRVSELCDLNMRDYDAKRGRLHILQGKGDKQRFLTLGKRSHKALWRYIASRDSPATGEPLFITGNDSRMDRSQVQKMIASAAKRAGIKHVHPHRLRHSFALQFLKNGGNVFELRELMGHEKLETTMIYLMLSEMDLEDAQRRHSPADKWKL